MVNLQVKFVQITDYMFQALLGKGKNLTYDASFIKISIIKMNS